MPGLDRTVRAAGTLCWRRTGDGLQVLVVRSARWDEWGWPKGKVERDETLAQCAVRETVEETGARAVLGAPLPSTSYVLPDGRPKEVAWWSARVEQEDGRTAPPEEIADVAWRSPGEARALVRDPGPLDSLLELEAAGRLDAPRLLVVRHAKARGRDRWDGPEADRPLTGTGRHQAEALAGLLACWHPHRLLTSPWRRCVETVTPYAEATDETPQQAPELTEAAHGDDPDRVRDLVRGLLKDGADAVLCTHRPVLAAVVETLAAAGTDGVTGRLPDADPWLATAEILVVHHADGRPFGAERHRHEPS